MDAAMASTTRMTVAETPCPGALASRFDATQGFSSAGRHFINICCDFAAHRVSHSAKKGVHFSVQFSGPSYLRGKEIGPGNRSPFFESHPAFFKSSLLDSSQRLRHSGGGAVTCKPAPHQGALW